MSNEQWACFFRLHMNWIRIENVLESSECPRWFNIFSLHETHYFISMTICLRSRETGGCVGVHFHSLQNTITMKLRMFSTEIRVHSVDWPYHGHMTCSTFVTKFPHRICKVNRLCSESSNKISILWLLIEAKARILGW